MLGAAVALTAVFFVWHGYSGGVRAADKDKEGDGHQAIADVEVRVGGAIRYVAATNAGAGWATPQVRALEELGITALKPVGKQLVHAEPHVLQDAEFTKLGSNKKVNVDVRVVTATNRDLEQMMVRGEFREDLYYRLNVVKLYIPSLAERREDIPLLANHSLTKLAERYRRGRLQFAPEAMEILVSAPWPGNVRQLLNVVEQAVALAATEVIPESLVRQALDVADTALTPLDEARKAFERDYLVRILKITGGNVTKAARLAGRNRTEFYRLLERHSLEPGMFKGSSQKEKATV